MKRFICVIGIALGCLSCSCFEASDYPPLPEPRPDGSQDIPPWDSDWQHDHGTDPEDEDVRPDIPLEPDQLEDPVADPPPDEGLDAPPDEIPDLTPEEPVEDPVEDEVVEDAGDAGEVDGD